MLIYLETEKTEKIFLSETALVTQLHARSSGDQEVAGSIPAGSGNILAEIDHEIFSVVILSLMLIQEGQ